MIITRKTIQTVGDIKQENKDTVEGSPLELCEATNLGLINISHIFNILNYTVDTDEKESE